jgi:two-component system, LytTR family, response regulator AlgR
MAAAIVPGSRYPVADQLRTLIVDDEPAAVRRLARLCEALPTVQIVATASDGLQALEVLDHSVIDLILLDIEMPNLSGVALGERLADRATAPSIVFVTAYERFAIQAFAVNAVGYLLKPVDPLLLQSTIARVERRITKPASGPRGTTIFWVPYRGTLIRLERKDIDRITGEDDYVRLRCGDASYLVAERLYAIEQRLGQEHFIRIHRSTLINRERIAALKAEAGSWFVYLCSGERLAIGRSFLPALRLRLGVTTERL